jgi:hypothetical protein
MRGVVVVIPLALAACARDVEPKPVPSPAVKAPPKPAPPPAKIVALEPRGNGGLCMRDTAGTRSCLHIERTWNPERYVQMPMKTDPFATDFTVGGTKCEYKDDTLACAGSAPIANVRYRTGGYYSYLEKPDGVAWFPAAGNGEELRDVAGIGKVAQLAVGWRVACALATDGAVSCWSDPRTPKKIATPSDVAQIFIQDPFELCVRTARGETLCTAPFYQGDDQLACEKGSILCGTAGAEEAKVRKAFDPLSKIVRPLATIAVPRASTLERDDDAIYGICMDSWQLVPNQVGGCAIEPATGAVACFASCGKNWRTYRVTGLPAMASVYPETTGGFGIARDHVVWTWQRPDAEDCKPLADVAATKLADVPPMEKLAATLYVQSGPSTNDHLRCGITVDGGTRCWVVPQFGRKPITGVFDPRALPTGSRR